MGPSGHYFTRMWTLCGHCKLIGQVCTFGRAPHTKETLPDFRKWCWVTRHPQVFRRLTGCQRTPQFWDVTLFMIELCEGPKDILHLHSQVIVVPLLWNKIFPCHLSHRDISIYV